MLKYDIKAKEDRIKCITHYKNANMKIKGKIGINHSSTMYQKLIREVVMKIDSKKIILEYT